MRVRCRSAPVWFILALAALLAACAQEPGAAGRALGEPGPSTEVAPAPLAPEAPSSAAGNRDRAAPKEGRREELAGQRGTGVFINQDALTRRQVTATEDGDITLNFANADLREVVRSVLGDLLRLNYVIDPALQGSITMQTSRPLAREAVLPALESALRANGATLIEQDGLYRVLPLEGAARSGGGSVVGLSVGASAQAYGVRIVPLRYISAAEMQRIAAPFLPSGALLEVDTDRNLLTLAGTGQQLEMVLNLVDIFDVDFLRGRSFALIPLSHGAAVRLRDELEAVFASHEDGALEGMIRFVPIERLNALLVISARPEYVDEARRWIEQLDRGAETGERRLYVYPVQNGRASDLAALLGSLFGTEQEAERADDPFPPGVATARIGLASAPIVVPPMGSLAGAAPAVAEGASLADAYGSPAGEPAIETAERVPGLAAGPASQAREAPGDQAAAGSALARGAFRIIADEPNNALVILATPKEYRTIQDALQHLDVVPLEVLIEATIAEVTLNEQLRYGLQWFFKFGTNSFTFADTGIPTPQFPGFSYLGTSGTDIRVVLNALDRVTDLNVVSSPQLVVLNNNVATLQVGDQVPVVTAQAVNVASDQTLINTIQFIDTGVILRVKPRVNASGLVTLELEQEVSDPIGAGLTPTINQRRIQSTVAVQDGETIALGGLIRDRRSKARNGIPGLSDIPIVGHAFSTTDRTDARTELLVLITPRVIRNRAEARRITEELRRRVRALEGLDSRIR